MNDKLAEGTPKLEEIAWQFIAHVFPSMDREQAQKFINEGAAILRPFIIPACSPDQAIRYGGALSFKSWLKMHTPLFSHQVNQVVDAHEAFAATPASTGEANGWISVEENGLPKVGQWCWVVCNGYVQRMAANLVGKGFACADGYEWAWAIDEADPCPLETVTHYQLIPLPPAPPA